MNQFLLTSQVSAADAFNSKFDRDLRWVNPLVPFAHGSVIANLHAVFHVPRRQIPLNHIVVRYLLNWKLLRFFSCIEELVTLIWLKNQLPLCSPHCPLCSMKLCSKVRLLCSSHEACAAAERKKESERVRVFAKAVGVSFQLLLVLSALLQNPPLTERERESEETGIEFFVLVQLFELTK